MTPTKPSNVDSLGDILSKYIEVYEEDDPLKAGDEAKAAIEQAMLQIIGRGRHIEEKYLNKCDVVAQEAVNKTLAEQRKRAKAFIGSNHSGRESDV